MGACLVQNTQKSIIISQEKGDIILWILGEECANIYKSKEDDSHILPLS